MTERNATPSFVSEPERTLPSLPEQEPQEPQSDLGKTSELYVVFLP